MFGLPLNMVAVIVVGYIGIAIVLALLGRRRKLGAWGYFFGSLLLTPIIGLLLLLASDPRPKGS